MSSQLSKLKAIKVAQSDTNRHQPSSLDDLSLSNHRRHDAKGGRDVRFLDESKMHCRVAGAAVVVVMVVRRQENWCRRR